MIVFDLRCGNDHVFEAWFASSDAFEDQQRRALVGCPMCGNSEVAKAVMAPRIAGTGEGGSFDPAQAKAMLAKLAGMQKEALKDSRWVGKSFAADARAMHHGEAPHAPIHGEATAAEARSLIEDGVAVAPLPFPVTPPGECN